MDELMLSMTPCQRTLLSAGPAAPNQFFSCCFNLASMMLLQLLQGRPLFLFPLQVPSHAWRVVLFIGFLRVCPIQPLFLCKFSAAFFQLILRIYQAVEHEILNPRVVGSNPSHPVGFCLPSVYACFYIMRLRFRTWMTKHRSRGPHSHFVPAGFYAPQTEGGCLWVG